MAKILYSLGMPCNSLIWGYLGDSGRIARESTERLEWSVELCRS